jgi:myxalamid-type polyketide synthase MxaB
LSEIQSPEREDRIAYRQGDRYVARLIRSQMQILDDSSNGIAPVALKITDYGILENLTWQPVTRSAPAAGEVEIQICSTGLNFRDVLNALGMLREYTAKLGVQSTADLPFGGECAGRIVAVGADVSRLKVGDEVIAAQAIGSFASYVTVSEKFVALKPASLSFEAAATIPIAFLTADYGLRQLANIQPGDRILIHAAAGGVGQAAVQIAQSVGAEIFATASPGKWDFLKSLGIKHVMNSRSLDFAQTIMDITQGEGVNIVLNSLNGEFIAKSFEVLASQGRFIEIGKLGIWDEQQVKHIRPDVMYFPFDLLDISMSHPEKIADLLDNLMQRFDQDVLQPLPHEVFSSHQVTDAFRYMAQAKHIGKVVVSQPTVPSKMPISDVTDTVQSDATYLITGGLGALGLKVAEWLVEQGAQQLVLMGRQSPSETAQSMIQRWQQADVQVHVAQVDISSAEAIADLLHTLTTTMPPLRGIIHAAGVLEDGMMLQQSWEQFKRVMAPKVEGTWYLHCLTQNQPLDFFVCFSSVSALLGSPGQSNYAAANAFMDALMQHRRAIGLPGLSINWGPWSEGGMAAALKDRDRARWETLGVGTIAPSQGLSILKLLLEQSPAQVGVLPIQWSRFISQFSRSIPPFLQVFAPTDGVTSKRSDVLQQLATAAVGDRRSLLTAHIRAEIAKVLGLSSPEQIELRQRLFDLGIDSLMAVELKSRLESSLDCSLRSTLIFDYPTVEALIDYLAGDVLHLPVATQNGKTDLAAPVASPSSEIVENLQQLSEAEAEALLLAELEKMNH